MEQPWEFKPDEERTSDTVRNFLLFCEGENSEPLYFKHFETIVSNTQINPLGQFGHGLNHVLKATKHCLQEDLIEVQDGGIQKKSDLADAIWCVYDRDLENPDLDNIDPKDNLDFTQSISNATFQGFNVAWSNDTFEVWILLHFEEIPVEIKLHRSYLYNRLTEIFKTLAPRTPALDLLTSNPSFNFKHFSKRRDNFINFIRPRLMERTEQAIENAEKLELHFSKLNLAFHDQNPCTKVHKLVQAIFGGA